MDLECIASSETVNIAENHNTDDNNEKRWIH